MIYRIIYQDLTTCKTWSVYFESQKKAEEHIQFVKNVYGQTVRCEKHAYKEVAWE